MQYRKNYVESSCFATLCFWSVILPPGQNSFLREILLSLCGLRQLFVI